MLSTVERYNKPDFMITIADCFDLTPVSCHDCPRNRKPYAEATAAAAACTRFVSSVEAVKEPVKIPLGKIISIICHLQPYELPCFVETDTDGSHTCAAAGCAWRLPQSGAAGAGGRPCC